MKKILKELLDVTKGCREDMYEPDKQGLQARIIGTKLDNTFGTGIDSISLSNGSQEIVVVIERDNKLYRFNLCSLIALARRANLSVE